MSLYSICDAIENAGLLTWVRETPWVYPIILSLHLICIAVFGGMILMTDLRLLGVGLKGKTVAEVVGGLRSFKRIGFVVIVTCGLLLAGSEATQYYQNPYFWTKMTLLVLVGVHALVFKGTVYDHPEELDKSPVLPPRAKAAAMLSLILWVSIPVCGRLIAYYEPEKEKAPQKVSDRPNVRLSMSKTTATYWNPLSTENNALWRPVAGLEGIAEELTLAQDPATGEYTRLTRFLPGADTMRFGGKTHAYPEEVFIVSGRLYDQAFGQWLEQGHYASRPPGELHGPFKTDVGCVVLELSFPNRAQQRG